MRFLLVIAIWIIIVGGLFGYITKRDARRMQATVHIVENIEVQGNFSIEITPTFSTEKDPFALTTSDTGLAPIEIRLNGVELSVSNQEVVRGERVLLEGVTGVLTGHNEIYVNASPPMSENTLEHGVRVKLIQDRTLVVDETIWAEQGSLISGTVSFMHQEEEEGKDDH